MGGQLTNQHHNVWQPRKHAAVLQAPPDRHVHTACVGITHLSLAAQEMALSPRKSWPTWCMQAALHAGSSTEEAQHHHTNNGGDGNGSGGARAGVVASGNSGGGNGGGGGAIS